ncbi:MAG: rRNA maturation RNase YbeY [Pseudomonadota bacterium]
MSLVELSIEEPGWMAVDLQALVEPAATAALEVVDLDPARFEISILGCDDDRIAALNGAFRGKAAPTNVLSWPAFDLAPAIPGASPKSPPMRDGMSRLALGDVAIALQTTSIEAKNCAIPLKNHVIHLILHGCLHLLGFDHETEADAYLMEGLEVEALDKLGIDNPYR